MQQTNILQVGTKNQTVLRIKQLMRSRSAREKHHSFALEGKRLILDAVQSGIRLQVLLLTPNAAEKYRAELDQVSVRRLFISEQLANQISDTESAQGIFAIGEMRQIQEISLQSGQHCLMLYSLQDPSNLGSILRTAEALGTDGIYLYQCCDLYNPKTLRSSMGAVFRLPLCRITDVEQFLQQCCAVKLQCCATVVDRDAVLLGQHDFSGGAVVFIGNEGNGLPREISSRCDVRLTIPMSPKANSLNAAMAAGIFLWEMRKGK